MIYCFLADGFEDAEALCPIDVMRRAGIDVTIAGIGGTEIRSSHNVIFKADALIDDLPSEGWNLAFAPGGMPGAVNVSQCWKANEIMINAANTDGAFVSAICASPAVVLGPLGLLSGKEATCYPGCEGYFPGFDFSPEGVVVSGNIVTTVFPSPSFFANLIAAATLVPLEIPHMIPSFAASSLDIRIASSSFTRQISS